MFTIPNRRGSTSARLRSTSAARKRTRRQVALEPLETRALLAVTQITLAGTAATMTITGGNFGATGLVIEADNANQLEWSEDGGATFSPDWDTTVPGVQPLAAASSSSVTMNFTDNAQYSLQLGNDFGPLYRLAASFTLNGSIGAGSTLDLNDANDPNSGAVYTYNGESPSNTFTGTLATVVNNALNPGAFSGGVTIHGGTGPDTFNIVGAFSGEPVNVVAGSGANVVNVGSDFTTPANSDLTDINNTVTVSDPTGSATINVNDAGSTTSGPANFDLVGGNYVLTGLDFGTVGPGGSVAYAPGTGVTALNVNLGTNGGAGVTSNVNATGAGTTTTITGGANPNTFLLSNPTLTGGLGNLAGPVVVNGGASGLDTVTLDDSSAAGNDDYTITPTMVTRTNFGGLTYGNIASLTLNAENTLGTGSGTNNIDINGTADNVATTVATQQGADTVNVNGTGTGGSLTIDTTDAGTAFSGPGATVNVVATSEPVSIVKNAGTTFNNDDVVNIGSTGGAGTLDGIQGPIDIVNNPRFFDLTIHDENGGARTFTLNNDDGANTASIQATGTVTALPPGTPFVTYRPGDLTSLTVNGGGSGNTFDVNNTTGNGPTTLNTGSGNDTVTVLATGNNTLDIHGQAGQDAVTLGGSTTPPLGAQGLNGIINVDNTFGFTDLTIDDSQDPIGQFGSITGSSVTGLSPATINYTANDLTSLTVNGGSGGNTFVVNGTPNDTNLASTPTTLNTGTGNDNTTVLATTANTTLAIHGQDGQDTVLIGDNGSTANINGAISVDNTNAFTDLTVDASNDAADHDISLSGQSPATLTGIANAPITYTTGDLSSLTLDTGPAGNQTLSIDFGTGNPLPAQGFPGLTWNAGADSSSAAGSHVLNLSGTLPTGAFTSEVHNAEGDSGPEHQGDIVFTDGAAGETSILYTGLQPINDTATATNYTFNDFAVPDGSFNAVNGPVVGGFTTIQFNSASTPPGAFETTNIANKTNVVFNANNPGLGVNGTVNITTPSDALATLEFNTNNAADNTVSFLNVPAGVPTSYNGSVEEDTTNVTGTGVPSGNTLTLNGGANIDTLNYDAGGLTPTVTAGANPGEVIITLPGFGSVDATNYENINITNVGPLTITPGPARTINSIEDFQLVDAIVGTFTLTLPPIVTNPAGAPASAFNATIDWGDPSPDNAAGTITQDASNPSVYYITGTHTFVDPGTYTVGTSIAYNGSPVTATVNGVTVSVSFSPIAPVAGAAATANVTNAALAVSAYPVVGVEGSTIPAGPIASFIDAGGSSGSADPSSAFSAVIDVVDSTGTTVLSVPAAGITQNAASNSYTVDAPALSLAGLDEGTYALRVTVTKMVNGTSVSATGGATAVLSDAPLTAGAAVALTPGTGVLLPNTTVVGNFTDANTGAAASDFTAVIDWGDGSPTSLGTVAGSGGAFTVAGGHRYTRPGSYTTTIVVTDDGGSQVTLTGSATVTDQAVVAGNPVTIRGVEGQNTGTVVLGTFTDPNTLATESDVSATLSAWGDGTPGSPVPVAVQLIGSGPNGAVFEILGSHTYLEETAAAGVTITMTVTTSGGVSTPITATAIIADAPLSSSGAPVSGIEGNSTGTVVVATFTDADPNGTATDYTATITWGDGSTSAGTIALVGGSPNGVVFSVSGSNTYAEAGSYPVSVAIADAGGAQTVAHSTATIVDAPLAAAATQPTVTATEGQPFSGPVATFTDGNPTGKASDFNYVLIDWGDGTPMSIGTVTGPVGGPFTVSGTHTFANTGTTVPGPGTSTIQVQVHDVDGATLNIANTATINVASSTVTGQLNPASDTGLSTGTPNVTSVQTPNFFGTVTPAVPGETVTLTATNAKGQTFQLGRAITNAAGDWNLTSGVALPTGTYAITAVATDPTGNVTSGTTPVTIIPSLVIDNVGPVVQNVVFNRGAGTILVTYADAALSDGSPGSGVSLPSITDAANYMFTRPHTRSNRFLITSITSMATGMAGEQQVALTINNGQFIRGGFNFNFTIFATNNARPSGVEDRAENGMQGVFYGTFPSGNGINGTNFNARLVAFHNRVLPAMTNVGTAHPTGSMTGAALFASRRHAAVRHAAVRRHHYATPARAR